MEDSDLRLDIPNKHVIECLKSKITKESINHITEKYIERVLLTGALWLQLFKKNLNSKKPTSVCFDYMNPYNIFIVSPMMVKLKDPLAVLQRNGAFPKSLRWSVLISNLVLQLKGPESLSEVLKQARSQRYSYFYNHIDENSKPEIRSARDLPTLSISGPELPRVFLVPNVSDDLHYRLPLPKLGNATNQHVNTNQENITEETPLSFFACGDSLVDGKCLSILLDSHVKTSDFMYAITEPGPEMLAYLCHGEEGVISHVVLVGDMLYKNHATQAMKIGKFYSADLVDRGTLDNRQSKNLDYQDISRLSVEHFVGISKCFQFRRFQYARGYWIILSKIRQEYEEDTLAAILKSRKRKSDTQAVFKSSYTLFEFPESIMLMIINILCNICEF
jgi:hypothetical protein